MRRGVCARVCAQVSLCPGLGEPLPSSRPGLFPLTPAVHLVPLSPQELKLLEPTEVQISAPTETQSIHPFTRGCQVLCRLPALEASFLPWAEVL